MQDPHSDDLLSAYIDGELTPEEQARVERWFEASPAARQELEDLRSISELVRNLPERSLGPDFAAEVLAAAERRMLLPEPGPAPIVPAEAPAVHAPGNSQPATVRRWSARWLAVGAPVAAAVALLIGTQFMDERADGPLVAERGAGLESRPAVPEQAGAPVALRSADEDGAALAQTPAGGQTPAGEGGEVAARSAPQDAAARARPAAEAEFGARGAIETADRSAARNRRSDRQDGGAGESKPGRSGLPGPEVAALRVAPDAAGEGAPGGVRELKMARAGRPAAAPAEAEITLQAGGPLVEQLLQQEADSVTVVRVYVQDPDAGLRNLQTLLARADQLAERRSLTAERDADAAPPPAAAPVPAPAAVSTGDADTAVRKAGAGQDESPAANALLVEADAAHLTAALAQLQADKSVVELQWGGTIEIAVLEAAAQPAARRSVAAGTGQSRLPGAPVAAAAPLPLQANAAKSAEKQEAVTKSNSADRPVGSKPAADAKSDTAQPDTAQPDTAQPESAKGEAGLTAEKRQKLGAGGGSAAGGVGPGTASPSGAAGSQRNRKEKMAADTAPISAPMRQRALNLSLDQLAPRQAEQAFRQSPAEAAKRAAADDDAQERLKKGAQPAGKPALAQQSPPQNREPARENGVRPQRGQSADKASPADERRRSVQVIFVFERAAPTSDSADAPADGPAPAVPPRQ